MNLFKFVAIGLKSKIYEKIGVIMARNKSSEEGFTLISTLISLSLILVSLPLMYHLVYEVKSTSKFELSPYKLIVFIEADIHRSKQMISKDNGLHFYLPNDKIAVIEQYGELIRRKVDNRGHEIYLRNVTNFQTENLEHGVKISIKLKNGEKYEKTFKVD